MLKPHFKASSRSPIDKQNRPGQAHRQRDRRLVKLLTLLIITNALVLSALGYFGYRYLHQLKPASSSLQQALGVKPANENLDTVRSNKYQFSIQYDNKQFKSVAYLIHPDGQNYDQVSGKDVLKPDAYSLITVFDGRKTFNEHLDLALADLTVSTNIHDNFFALRAAQYGPGLSQLDMVQRFFRPTEDQYNKLTVGKASTVTINGIEYRRVVYTQTNTQYLTSQTMYEYYYTVQNGRPYAVSVSRAEDPDKEFVASLRQLIGNISYGEQSQSAPYGTYGTANTRPGGKANPSSSSQSGANLPSELESGTALEVAARNQPAVVRIGGNYCATITLTLPNKQEFMKVPNACSPVVGSGTIVSNDGYISTNGHVVRQTPPLALLTALSVQLEDGNQAPMKKYLQYLIASGVMSQDQLEALLAAAKNGDAAASNKIIYSAENIPRANITATDEYNEYAIQLGHDPMQVDRQGSKFRFKYTSTVVQATYIDSNFDPYSGSEGKSDITDSATSDVAVLKIPGKDYPVAKLGSIDNLKRGDLITAIGFPAFVDDGLETKLHYTVPTVTQGYVRAIVYDSPAKVRKLVQSNTPIAGGNSGGPAFTIDGRMAGLNTYGSAGCPDDECFGTESYFRNVADFKALLAQNNISIKDASPVQATWDAGIAEFVKKDYRSARKSFETARQEYPAFYLADSFIAQADDQIKAIDKANLLKIAFASIGFVSIVGLVITFRTIRSLRRHRKSGQSAGYYPIYPSNRAPSPQPAYPSVQALGAGPTPMPIQLSQTSLEPYPYQAQAVQTITPSPVPPGTQFTAPPPVQQPSPANPAIYSNSPSQIIQPTIIQPTPTSIAPVPLSPPQVGLPLPPQNSADHIVPG